MKLLNGYPNSPVFVIATLILGVAFAVLPVHAVAQQTCNHENDANLAPAGDDPEVDIYCIHDLEDTAMLTRATWAAQWVYSPQSLQAVVPLYAYNLCDSEQGEQECVRVEELCGDYMNTGQELGGFTALMLGQQIRYPRDYELGHAGLALEPGDQSGNGTSSTGLLLSSSLDAVPWDRLTLENVCDQVPAIMRSYGNGDAPGSTWLFVTENPIPNRDPNRRFWTHLTRDFIADG